MATTTAVRLPQKAVEIIEKKSFAQLATIMPDGTPQVSPVWVDHDEDEILINTAEGRVKARNMRREPDVALSIPDPDDPYAAVLVRGRVAEMEHEDADEHIDQLAQKYLGEDTYPFRQPGEVRVKVRIAPERVAMTN